MNSSAELATSALLEESLVLSRQRKTGQVCWYPFVQERRAHARGVRVEFIIPTQQHNEGRNELRYEGFTSL